MSYDEEDGLMVDNDDLDDTSLDLPEEPFEDIEEEEDPDNRYH